MQTRVMSDKFVLRCQRQLLRAMLHAVSLTLQHMTDDVIL